MLTTGMSSNSMICYLNKTSFWVYLLMNSLVNIYQALWSTANCLAIYLSADPCVFVHTPVKNRKSHPGSPTGKVVGIHLKVVGSNST